MASGWITAACGGTSEQIAELHYLLKNAGESGLKDGLAGIKTSLGRPGVIGEYQVVASHHDVHLTACLHPLRFRPRTRRHVSLGTGHSSLGVPPRFLCTDIRWL